MDDWSLDGGILVCHHVPLKIADVGLGISVSGKGFYCASVPLKSYTHEVPTFQLIFNSYQLQSGGLWLYFRYELVKLTLPS